MEEVKNSSHFSWWFRQHDLVELIWFYFLHSCIKNISKQRFIFYLFFRWYPSSIVPCWFRAPLKKSWCHSPIRSNFHILNPTQNSGLIRKIQVLSTIMQVNGPTKAPLVTISEEPPNVESQLNEQEGNHLSVPLVKKQILRTL